MLTVVICVRDMAHLLPRALASVRAADELIVIDDGSADGSGDVAREAGARVIRLAGEGLPAARNAGVAAATGDYVTFLDADDELLGGAPDPRVSALEADPSAGVALGLVELVGPDGERVGDPFELWGPCTLARREVFARVGPFDATVEADDLDWLLRARDMGVGFVSVPQLVYRYHRHPAAMTAARATAERFLISALRRRVQRERISVVMPTRDGGPHLAESLASLAAQTHPAYEVILVADVPLQVPDGVRVIDGAGLSLSAAYNRGVEASSGELIALAADDDVCLPEKHARQVAALADADGSVCWVESFLDGPAPPGFRSEVLEAPRVMRLPEALVVRRSAWDRVGGFDESVSPAGDVDWFARADDAGLRFAVAEGGVLLRKRYHGGSSSHAARTLNAAMVRAMRRSIERKRA